MLKNLKMFSGIALLAIACSAMADDLGPTLQKIKDTGIISLGVRYDSPPFNYNLGGNQQAGYSYDISTKIVDAVKQQTEYADVAGEGTERHFSEPDPAADERHN